MLRVRFDNDLGLTLICARFWMFAQSCERWSEAKNSDGWGILAEARFTW